MVCASLHLHLSLFVHSESISISSFYKPKGFLYQNQLFLILHGVLCGFQLEQNIKAYVKNLSEVFWFIHQFAVLGRDEV